MPSLERHQIEVRGIVQGVGFRPFVYRIARDLGLVGSVRNTAGSVQIDAQGNREALHRFVRTLKDRAPHQARIDAIEVTTAPVSTFHDFFILESTPQTGRAATLPPDIAPCEACLRELTDPANRRYGYPFINCTECGPRFTIAHALPYDRPLTTMHRFAMCNDCEREYHDPNDRRFHAQPISCPACGPRLWITDGSGNELTTPNPITTAVQALLSGKVVALKGIGGFHLAVNACDHDAVMNLRNRKQREAKPFAVMVQDLAMARTLARVDYHATFLLVRRERPIVILPQESNCAISPAVAPDKHDLGIMLPSSPLHELLLREIKIPLVMTSGNLSDEPILFDNNEAIAKLGSIADFFLLHDRDIHLPCDDSVVRPLSTSTIVIRRGRGHTLASQHLPLTIPSVLAVGGDLKGCIVLAQGDNAFPSQHVGDLESVAATQLLTRTTEHLCALTGIEPRVVAHDLHPTFHSTAFAQEFATLKSVPLVAVQHHHAHIASCMADNDLPDQDVIGIALDGTGFGTDGTIWGGEVLIANYRDFTRAYHLRPLPLPGGDMASRQGWRMALAALVDAEIVHPHNAATWEPFPFAQEIGHERIEAVLTMIERNVQCIPTSSCGRWFDAVAALLGIRTESRYEGEAANLLEGHAHATTPNALPFSITDTEIDLRPTIHAMVHAQQTKVPTSEMAFQFHATIADAFTAAATTLRDRRNDLTRVCLSGGCFQNVLLTRLTADRLSAAGFEVFTHRHLPPNDGGIALGQALIAGRKVS